MEPTISTKKKTNVAYSYIRFSSPQQMKGDSLRRQTEASEEYANTHGLRLDYGLHLHDLGVSAYRGRNSTEGALAGFMTAIETGRVSAGSILLVESLDRLSRTEIMDALALFTNIIRAGITIVTLTDSKLYNRDAINQNPTDLILSILIMVRAHEESATKGLRVAKAWARKRQVALETKNPQSKLCPAWLELTKSTDGVKSYAVIPERALLLVRMFKPAGEGRGKRLIARTFDSEGIPPWGDGAHWAPSSILYFLNNRTALGIFQPHRLDPETRRRIPDGPPIDGYYPQVVSNELWQRAHNRPTAPTGPRGPKTNNLFSGLVIDGYTGFKMHYIDKASTGQKRNRGDQRYLRSNVYLPDGAKSQFWPYAHFEQIVLEHLKQLDWATIVNHGPDAESATLNSQIAEAEMHTAKLQAGIEKFLDSLTDMPDALLKAAKARAASAAEELEDTERRLDELREMRDRLAVARNSVAEGIAEFKALISNGDPSKRLALQMEIRRRVKSITAYRYGHAPQFKGTAFEKTSGNEWSCVTIEYRNGRKQTLMSSPGNAPKIPARRQKAMQNSTP